MFKTFKLFDKQSANFEKFLNDCPGFVDILAIMAPIIAATVYITA